MTAPHGLEGLFPLPHPIPSSMMWPTAIADGSRLPVTPPPGPAPTAPHGRRAQDSAQAPSRLRTAHGRRVISTAQMASPGRPPLVSRSRASSSLLADSGASTGTLRSHTAMTGVAGRTSQRSRRPIPLPSGTAHWWSLGPAPSWCRRTSAPHGYRIRSSAPGRGSDSVTVSFAWGPVMARRWSLRTESTGPTRAGSTTSMLT